MFSVFTLLCRFAANTMHWTVGAKSLWNIKRVTMHLSLLTVGPTFSIMQLNSTLLLRGNHSFLDNVSYTL